MRARGRATPSPRGRGGAVLLVVSALLSTLLAACAHGPQLLDQRPERIDALLAKPASGYDESLERGWAGLVAGCDWSTAVEDLKRAAAAPGPERAHLRQLAWLGIGLIHLSQANFPAALEAFEQALAQDARSPEALVAALQVAELAHQVPGGHAHLAEEVRKMLSRRQPTGAPTVGPEVARTLRRILQEGALRAGDLEGADKLLAEMGVPPVWRVGYPFGRHPLLAFDQDFAPEHHPLEAGSLPDQAVIRPVWPAAGRLVFSSDRSDGVLYAEAFFHLEQASRLGLRLRSQASWMAFVDEVRLDRHAAHLAHLPGIVHLAFEAEPGWHRLLLKVSVRQGAAEVGVELTRADGREAPVTWWRWPQPAPELGPGRAVPMAAPAPPRAALLDRARANPNDAATPVLAGLLAWEAGDLAAAQRMLDSAQAIAPAFALPDYLSGLLHLEDPDLPPGMDAVRAEERFGAALEKCPDLALAAFRRALLQADQGHESEALEALENLERQRPASFLWPHYAGRIQASLGWEQEARFSQLRALARMPDNPEILTRLFELALKHDAVAEQEQLAEQLEELGRWDPQIVDLWLARGRTDRAQGLLRGRLQRQPGDLAARLALVGLLQRAGDLAGADEQLAQAERIDPGRLDVALARVDLLERKGEDDRAMKLRRELARRYPWHLHLRKALAARAGQSEIRLIGSEQLDAQALIETARAAGPPPRADAIVLFDGATAEVAADGSSIERIQTLVQVLSPDGLERWGEVDSIPPGAEIERLRTIKADGSIHRAEIIPGKDSITLPGLQQGDFVELAWIHGLRRSGPLARSYLGRPFLFGLIDTPILHSRYSVSVPAHAALVIDRLNGAPAPERAGAASGEMTYTFERRGEKALKAEQHSVPIEEIAPLIQTGFGVTWSDLRDILRLELLEAARLTPGISDYARRAAGRGEPRARIQRLFRKVCDEIRQSGPTTDFSLPAAYALARREGNRVVVLYALLRALGFEPRVLLARTVGQPQRDFALPSEDSYSHGLLAVSLPASGGEQTVWLDPLDKFAPFSVLFPFLSGMPAIEVTGQRSQPVFTSLPQGAGRDLHKQIELDLKLFTDGTLAGTGREVMGTFQAVRYREALVAMTPTERRQALEAGLGGYFSGALLEKFELEALEDPSRPLGIAYRFRVPAWARRRGDLLVLQGGFYPYQLGQNLITHTKRTTPLLLADRTLTRTHVVLKLPPGARARIPEAVNWTAPLGSFQMRVSQAGQRLEIDKRLTVEAGRVAPKDYPAFRDFCLKVDAKEAAGITVRLPSIPKS